MTISLADITAATAHAETLEPVDMTKLFWVIYGEKQVGKSTFTSRFPKPFYLDAEHRLDSITTPEGVRPPQRKVLDWDEVVDWTNAFISTTPADTGVETLVIDGGGVAFRYLAEKVLKTSKKGARNLNDEDLGYAKGWFIARDEYLKWFMNLRKLKEQGYGIVITTHDRSVPFTNNNIEMEKKVPTFADDKDEKYGWNVLRAFPDMVVYANKQMTPSGIVHMAQIRGNQMIEAGCPTPPKGHQLPDALPFSFDAFRKAWDGES